jgi:streptogramin lyase
VFLAASVWMSGCGDSGDGTAGESQSSSTSPVTTSGTTAGTGMDTTTATSAPTATSETPTTSGATQGETLGTTAENPTGTTAEPGTSTDGTTGPVSGTSTGGTTGPVSGTSTGEDSSTSEGPKLDMGVPVCPPDDQASTFAYIWIANTSQGTVSKINTMDGKEEGRYYTHPNPGQAQPSRTSVNQYGDVAVSNRGLGSVTKVAALKVKCIDKNGNGQIDTSTGANDIKAWGQDECVLWHTAFPLANGFSGGVRPTAWEGVAQDQVTCETPVPRLWVGYKDAGNTAHFARLHGDTGVVLDDVLRPNWSSNSFGPYGGAVNSAGDLFSIGYDNEVSIRIDATTLQITELGKPPGSYKYGMGVDSNGNMWVGSFSGPHHMYFFDAQANQWQGIGNGGNPGGGALGVQIDNLGRVWGAANGPCRLIEADVETKQFIKTDIVLPGCSSPWGVSIDNEGYVWVVDKGNKAFKVDPDTYEIKLIVTGLINPYTYSDMTGQGLQLVLPQ